VDADTVEAAQKLSGLADEIAGQADEIKATGVRIEAEASDVQTLAGPRTPRQGEPLLDVERSGVDVPKVHEGGGEPAISPPKRRESTGERGSQGRPGASSGISLGRTAYGESRLSRIAQKLRLTLGLRRGGNVAVFEFEDIPEGFQRIVRRLGGRNVKIDGNCIAFQNVSEAAHSEELAHALITQGRKSGHALTVRRIYTEYNPCTGKCLPLIRRQYPQAEVSYSFVWERWGRETPDRNAAVDALFEGR
jgi:hypothetical protein